jgi:hypothetical protein
MKQYTTVVKKSGCRYTKLLPDTGVSGDTGKQITLLTQMALLRKI